MGISVRQALEIDALKEAKVVAGHQGLDNVISFVNIMEVPEVTKWMKGGELLVTAGFALKDRYRTRRKLIYDLAAKGVAAFGIKPGQYFQEIPDDMIEYANEVGMPLIELPHDVPYMDFMVPIFESLIGYQMARLKKEEQIHNHLIEIVLSGSGLPSVCQTLVELSGNPVLITNVAGDPIASAWPPYSKNCTAEYADDVMRQLDRQKAQLVDQTPNRRNRFALKLDGHDQSLMAVRIEVSDTLHGFLVVLETHKVLDDQDIRAVEQASTIVALEFLKERIVYETEKQIRVELLEDLISGNFRSEEDVVRRAAHLNFNLSGRTAVFIMQMSTDDKGRTGSIDQRFRNEFFQTVQHSIRDFPGGALLLTKTDALTGLVHIPSNGDIAQLKKKLSEIKALAHSKWPKFRFSIGVGRSFEGLNQIKKSNEEALDALRIVSFMYDDSRTVFFETLGAYTFLFELEGSSAMANFFERTLGQVIAFDRQNKSELLKTLAYYFKYDGNLRVTAEQLFLHKNSVLYRIRKIEEITGLNMNDPEDKFNLQLAIKISQVIKNLQSNSE